MTNQSNPLPGSDGLDELVTQLLECGAVLSQMIAGMVEFDASGRATPDAAPIPQMAHWLIRDVSDPVRKRHSKRDICVAAKIVEEMTDRICNDIFVVPSELIDEARASRSDEPRQP